jgi:hypothetical protein
VRYPWAEYQPNQMPEQMVQTAEALKDFPKISPQIAYGAYVSTGFTIWISGPDAGAWGSSPLEEP